MGGGGPVCEWAVVLQLSMASEDAWGRGQASACSAISEVACHFFLLLFSLEGGHFCMLQPESHGWMRAGSH